MTWKEMFDGISADAQKIQIRIDKIYPKAIRVFKKSIKFPVWYVDEYRIPATNNQHIIFFYAGNVNEAERPHYTSYSIIFSNRQRFVIKAISSNVIMSDFCTRKDLLPMKLQVSILLGIGFLCQLC